MFFSSQEWLSAFLSWTCLYAKNGTCYFRSRDKKLRHIGMRIQRHLVYFGKPSCFQCTSLSLCKHHNSHYTPQWDVWLRATPRDKAAWSMTLKISELLLGQSDSDNVSLEFPFQKPGNEHFFIRAQLLAGSVSKEAQTTQANLSHSAPLLSTPRLGSEEDRNTI